MPGYEFECPSREEVDAFIAENEAKNRRINFWLKVLDGTQMLIAFAIAFAVWRCFFW